MNFSEIKSIFLSNFRDLFIYHHKSLEFRAKIFALMIAADNVEEKKEYEKLEKIAKQIYKKDDIRALVLVNATKEYVQKVITKNELTLDQLVLNIDKLLKINPKLVKKINLEHLEKLTNPSDNDVLITQNRIIEFLENEIKDYTK